jgi:hypothetical protein
VNPVPSAAVAGLGLLAGYAVAVASGSRPLGGVVLLLAGIWCVRVWLRRDGPRVAALLGGVGIAAFIASHLLALVIGAWPAVLVCAGLVAGACWRVSDARAGLGRPAPART